MTVLRTVGFRLRLLPVTCGQTVRVVGRSMTVLRTVGLRIRLILSVLIGMLRTIASRRATAFTQLPLLGQMATPVGGHSKATARLREK